MGEPLAQMLVVIFEANVVMGYKNRLVGLGSSLFLLRGVCYDAQDLCDYLLPYYHIYIMQYLYVALLLYVQTGCAALRCHILSPHLPYY